MSAPEPLAPLSNSKSKEDLLRYLGLSQQTYALMAHEVERVYEWFTNDKAHLVPRSKNKPKPYAWSDFNSSAKDEAIIRIAQSPNPETQYYWSQAVPQKECSNWIARWFLYHKCRHCDGRNRNSRQREDLRAGLDDQRSPRARAHAVEDAAYTYPRSPEYDYAPMAGSASPPTSQVKHAAYTSLGNALAYDAVLQDNLPNEGRQGFYDPVRDR